MASMGLGCVWCREAPRLAALLVPPARRALRGGAGAPLMLAAPGPRLLPHLLPH